MTFSLDFLPQPFLSHHQRIFGDFCLADQTNLASRFEDLAQKGAMCLNRDHFPGHITVSTMILSPDWKQTLLTEHRKLGLWLQLGGHCDGDPILIQTSQREVEEESGLTRLKYVKWWISKNNFYELNHLVEPLPFDLDIHRIPANQSTPEHFHYDIRFLAVADPHQNLTISEESLDLKWVELSEAAWLGKEDSSMLRMIQKVKMLP